MKIYFGTSNEKKLKEAKAILGIEVEGTTVEVDEIQSLDPIEVAQKKAKGYYDQLKMPVFIEDVSLIFHGIGRLPGTYISDFMDELGTQGLVDLLQGKQDRTASLQATIVYYDDSGATHVFEGVIKGTIADAPRGDSDFGFDPIFIPDGHNKTYAEMGPEEKNKLSHRAIALGKLREFLDQEAK